MNFFRLLFTTSLCESARHDMTHMQLELHLN